MKSGSEGAVWRQSVAFAARQHRDQIRGDDGTPYIAHPMRVECKHFHHYSPMLYR